MRNCLVRALKPTAVSDALMKDHAAAGGGVVELTDCSDDGQVGSPFACKVFGVKID